MPDRFLIRNRRSALVAARDVPGGDSGQALADSASGDAPLTEPFWLAALRGELLCQRCDRCLKYFFPPEMLCTHCSSGEWTWQRTEGRGSLYSFTIVHRTVVPGLGAPFVLAIVEVEEGFYMLTNIVDTPPERLAIGMPVSLTFRPAEGGRKLPVFTAAVA